jgi:hypothetical protein
MYPSNNFPKAKMLTLIVTRYDNRIVLFKMESDVMMYVVGGLEENEVLLYNVNISFPLPSKYLRAYEI